MSGLGWWDGNHTVINIAKFVPYLIPFKLSAYCGLLIHQVGVS